MPTRRIRIALAGALALWAGAAVWFVPAVIGWLAGGGGPAVLRRMMRGRGTVPVEAYFAAWNELALRMTFVLVTLGIIAWFLLPLLNDRRRELPVTASDVAGAAPAVDLSKALWVSAWCGLVLGLGESYYLAWKTFVLREAVPDFHFVSVESVWMAPVVDVVALTAIGILSWGIGRLVRRPLTFRWLVILATFVGLLSLIQVTGRLSTWAGLLLSAGLASRVGSGAARRSARFLLNVRRTVPKMAAAVIAVALLVTVVPRVAERRAVSRLPAASATAPNVLVVVLDTERASSMGLYGYDRPTTPTLAGIAQRGVVFDRAMAPSSWTLPSHASMFTGQYPGNLRFSYVDPLDDTYPTVAGVLRDRGFMTAGFAANFHFFGPLFGLQRGFTHFEAQPVSLEMTLESAWLFRAAHRLVEPRGEKLVVRKDAADLTQDFLAWQAAQPNERPYLAFLNYFDAHAPYLSPPSYSTLFGGSAVPPAVTGQPASLYTPAELQAFVDAYDGAIAYVDAQLKVLLDELERRGQLQRTVVIVTADHGEEFGEHGKLGHGFGVNLPLIHVPLLVLHPSLPAGVRVSQAVTLADLPATVMDLVGGRDHPFRGRSWSRFWSPVLPADTVAEPVFSELGSLHSFLVGNWHYIAAEHESLFDVIADPREQVDLIATADPALLAQLRAARDRFRSQSTATGR